jgi:molybdate transport system substrate-binding protein
VLDSSTVESSHRMHWRPPPHLLAFLVLVTVTCACEPKSPEQLHIAAAASLSPAFTELSRLYEEETGEQILLTFSSTGALSEQIRNGAPYDIFASADREHLEKLIDEGYLLGSSQVLFAYGDLVLLISPDYSGSITGLSDLLQTNIHRIAMANPEVAPYGLAARQVLEDADLWKALTPKIVMAETVQQAYVFVSTGNAEAGIIARSVLPDGTNDSLIIQLAPKEPPEHWAAILVRSVLSSQAEGFLRYLQSPTARLVLNRYGFQTTHPNP